MQQKTLKKYVAERKKRDKAFAEGYEQFKINAVLKQARETTGPTQEELAQRLKTKKTAMHGSRTMLKMSSSRLWKKSPMLSGKGWK